MGIEKGAPLHLIHQFIFHFSTIIQPLLSFASRVTDAACRRRRYRNSRGLRVEEEETGGGRST